MREVSFPYSPTKWYQIDGKIQKVLKFDKVSVEDVHPTRILSEWVLVLITKGVRTVRIGEDPFEIHAGEFFILPSGVPHSGILLDRHQAYFSHFYADSKEVTPPTRIDPDKILLPLSGQLPVDTHCIDVMDYAVRHRVPPF